MPSTRTAALYNRWLHTLGGGEQDTLALYSSLERLGYHVVILTHRYVDAEAIRDKFAITIPQERIVLLERDSPDYIGQLSDDYDLFVNLSHLEYIPVKNHHSILHVFFPAKQVRFSYEWMKRAWIVPLLQRSLSYVSFVDRTPAGLVIRFNKPVSAVSVSLHFPEVSTKIIEQTKMIATESGGKSWFDVQSNSFRARYRNPAQPLSTITIALPENSQYHAPEVSIDDWSCTAYQLFKKFLPTQELRLHGGPINFSRNDLATYGVITCNSEFTRSWIKQYWGVDAHVLYPAVDVDRFSPAKKKTNTIVHVGRFFATGHNKKQLELVQSFCELVDSGVRDWQFHLVGSIADGAVHHAYVQKIRQLADGYPVFFHIDAPFEELRELLSHAKIYWHATGLDEDVTDPSKMEHFGITTVEAMASGAVPVVIDAGGQREIVTSESGVLWRTRAELIEQTKLLIDNPERTTLMSTAAIERSKYFSVQKSHERVTEILSKLV